MKIPNLASSYQVGTGTVFNESQSASYWVGAAWLLLANKSAIVATRRFFFIVFTLPVDKFGLLSVIHTPGV